MFKRIKKKKKEPAADDTSSSIEETFKISTEIDVMINRWDPVKKEYKGWYQHDKVTNLKTNAGLTFFLSQCYAGNSGGSIGTNGTNFMALTSTAITPAVGDTTLSGEIVANGFSRVQATVVISQPTATITGSWTASGTQNNIQGGALFTLGAAGTMGHEFTFLAASFGNLDLFSIIVTITIS